jgi:ribosomal protein S18 acetylase RimI-like enzyme
MRNNSSLPDDLILREFSFPTDYSNVIALWMDAGPGIHLRLSDEKDEIAKKLTRDPDLFLVAEVAGQIIGSVLGGFDGRRGMVYHLAEDSFFAKKNGTALMEELAFDETGCVRAYLLVTRDNLEAVGFYESNDWEQMDLLIFGKDLK